MKYLLRLLVVLCFSALPVAHAEGGFLSLELGQGDIDIDDTDRLPFVLVTDSNNDNAVAASIGGGYVFANGVYVDVTFTDIDSVTLFGLADFLDLRATKLGVGYMIPAGERFNFLVKTGLSVWDLDVRESAFLNPGPEESTGFDGTDAFVELGAEWHVFEKYRISLTHTFDKHDLGDASATRVGFRFFWDPK